MNYKTLRKNGKSIRIHRIIMEKKLGRPLKPEEIVHHLDGDIFNNKPNNLKLTNHKEHRSFHMAPIIDVKCNWCGKIIKIREKKYKWKKLHQKNIYCSNQCTGFSGIKKPISTKFILSEINKGKTIYQVAKEQNVNKGTLYTRINKTKVQKNYVGSSPR